MTVKEKSKLIEVLKQFMVDLSTNEKAVKNVKKGLSKYGITAGAVENIMSNPEVLEESDRREVALFVEEFYKNLSIQALEPTQWFTEVELKRARQFDKRLLTEDMADYTIAFDNTAVVGNGVYSTTIDIKTIAELFDAQVLNYNYEIQRQAKITKRKDQIVYSPTVYRKNVKEIKEYLLKDQLISTTLAFNAASGSSDSGEELTFDANTGTLVINEGTQLDILDGFHRCLASIEAYRQNPDLKFRFMLMISNFTTREAQQYQAQLAKATPIPKTRVQELEANRHADAVVRQLKSDSELRDKVSSHHQVKYAQGELVSYKVLADAIDREFNMRTNKEVREVSKFLTEFFDELIGSFPDEFLDNSSREKSLMNYSKMFAGYIALAAKMRKEKIELDKLESTMKGIDFTKENDEWKQLGILNSDGKISNKADDKKIANHFKQIEMT